MPPIAGGALPEAAGAPALPTAKPPPLPPGPDPFLGGARPGGLARRPVSSGTGFVVAPGRLLTNWHVAEGCAELRARTSRGLDLPAQPVARDAQRDLALLAVAGEVGPPLPFRTGPEVRRGEGVVTYGFPLAGMLSSGATLTTGDISALSGLRDNPRHYQISAPVQVGNSGGPLLDLGGRVIGVVVAKLDAQRIAQVTGDLPQNVNFAVKGGEALEFLQRNGIRPVLADGRAGLSAADVGEVAEPSTVLLRCLR
ncbi:serine protease [Roseicella aquatilis]|uniref:Serine protease n=1 Tax=Roseicella aquatilis TaxID=2527868 RepID=A0A4R4D1Y7_9PROT|nr:serine protease [Roseicella aquatilis]